MTENLNLDDLPARLRDHARDCEMLDMAEGRPALIREAADQLDAARKRIAELEAGISGALHEAEHHHAGCEPGPWKRMPPELRNALERARTTLNGGKQP